MEPVNLKPLYIISVNEIVEYDDKQYVVQDFNVKTLSFILLSSDGTIVEAYHRNVKKINKTSSFVNINDN